MARNLLRAISGYGYDRASRRVHQWLRLDGTADLDTVLYTFPNRAARDGAAAIDHRPADSQETWQLDRAPGAR